MAHADIITSRWDAERKQLDVQVGDRGLWVSDEALDTWRFDLDHLPAEFTGTFRGPEFGRVREGLRPGYEAAQAARTALRLEALDQAVTEVCAPLADMIPEAIEAALAKRGYRIVRT